MYSCSLADRSLLLVAGEKHFNYQRRNAAVRAALDFVLVADDDDVGLHHIGVLFELGGKAEKAHVQGKRRQTGRACL